MVPEHPDPQALNTVCYRAVDFGFEAVDRVRFPATGAGNAIRGALGLALRGAECRPDCPGRAGRPTRECRYAAGCAYSAIFEPAASGGPSGWREPPRPFVLRTRHLDGAEFSPGSRFEIRILFFPREDLLLPAMERAFARFAEEGPRRQRARLRGVEMAAQQFRLNEPGEAARAIRVDFLTPTELKAAGRVAPLPQFPALFARVRDRVSALQSRYGGAPLQFDFRELAARAEAIATTRCEIAWTKQARRSGKTGQTHPLGGFTGTAGYAGELAVFLPWLRAAEWTGAGRQTVWGKGELRVTVEEP